MTLIAYYQGKIYTDTQCGGSNDLRVTKQAVDSTGGICAITGQAGQLHNWLDVNAITESHTTVLQLRKDGSLWVHNDCGFFPVDARRVVAFGSGADIFLGAIATGVSLDTALAIVETLDHRVSGPYHVWGGEAFLEFEVKKYQVIKELR